MRISCIITFCFTAKHINNQGGGMVKLEALYPLKHWHSLIGLNGVKSGKTYVAKHVFTLTYFLHQYYPTVTSIYIMLLQT
jgi:hypothetical protein